ncbi:glycoside hydrolase family protein [Spirochaetia bacterium]|nr:glycoside hydrolase family protein [Spirochaetia bacterium]
MSKTPVISLVLNAHLPFIHNLGQPQAPEEQWFFEALSETYLPLLELFEKLDADHVPFKMALSFSPVLCHLLDDELLCKRYLEYVDKQIEFGLHEIDRTAGREALFSLARHYYDRTVEKRQFFTGHCGCKLLPLFDLYQKKGRLELLASPATHAFLPFYGASEEALRAQVELAVASYRHCFGRLPQGFALPEMGWSAELEGILRAFNFSYTMIEPHGLLSAETPARRGSFYPVKTPGGIYILGRDFYSAGDLERIMQDGLYRNNREDAGYELEAELVKPFLLSRGGRTVTGYKYWASIIEGNDDTTEKVPYNRQRAAERAALGAKEFLDARRSRLTEAGKHFDDAPLSLCVFDADQFGRFWYEGIAFLEALFREGAKQQDCHFMNPAEYLFKQDITAFQTVSPEFSSRGFNGYGENWLSASNDWIYPHLTRSLQRMVELAERFPDETGLRERALNQAAREILLAQSSDWPRLLYNQESTAFARSQAEASLRNFTTIYEALGSDYLSTEWLTVLERRNNIFPRINYRIFRRKK